MNVALLAVDSNYPNLALMKVSAWHKSQGDTVEWYNPFDTYDRLYMAKVFSFTPDYGFVIANVRGEVVRGGTGYDIRSSLPGDMDRLQPDYSLYPAVDSRTSYGFLTRGCPNRCRWCVVPQKEGGIRPYMDVDDITLHGERPYAVLMDNNVLACDYGLSQLEKIAERRYHVDFNQGLDARLVTSDVARLLARVKWIKRIRFGCDTPAQIAECERAMSLVRQAGYKGEFFLYCILIDFAESYYRLNYWRKYKYVSPHAQPYRDLNNPHQRIPQWQKDMARWADRKELYRSCDFKDFSPRKGFLCREYFT